MKCWSQMYINRLLLNPVKHLRQGRQFPIDISTLLEDYWMAVSYTVLRLRDNLGFTAKKAKMVLKSHKHKTVVTGIINSAFTWQRLCSEIFYFFYCCGQGISLLLLNRYADVNLTKCANKILFFCCLTKQN